MIFVNITGRKESLWQASSEKDEEGAEGCLEECHAGSEDPQALPEHLRWRIW